VTYRWFVIFWMSYQKYCHVFPMTVLSSSWVSWFSEIGSFSKHLYWIPWTSWLSLNNNLEGWKTKALSEFVPSWRDNYFCSCWSNIVSPFWICYPSNLWFEFGLSSNQTQSQGLPYGVSTCGFHLNTSSFPSVYPIFLPWSYNIWVHLLGASK
jgi:hypothetical protein